ASPHRRLGAPEGAELLDALPRHDGTGQHVKKPRERLLQGEAGGRAIDRLDAVPRLQHRGIGVALDRAEWVYAVGHVLGSELPRVGRRLSVPARAPAKLEDVRGLVQLAPGLG